MCQHMELEDDLPPYPDDIVPLLVLEAGRLMEDASLEFAKVFPRLPSERSVRLTTLCDLARAIHSMMRTAVDLDVVNQSSLEARSDH